MSEIFKGVSPISLITTATGIASAVEGHSLAIQDISVNIARSGMEDLISRFGVVVAVVGLITMLYDHRRASQMQINQTPNEDLPR
jgi:hypothetical protein